MSDPVARLNAALEGRYRIERELGQGGMATVYLAQDLRHERKVALKVLKPELAAVVGAERFLTEIKTTANLQHPHILPLFDSGEADSFLFYVMPYVEGETLRDRLDREKQFPIDDAVRIATSVASALDHAHRHGVVHRDIKPANIMLQDGQPVVGDFGIALAVGAAGGARLTETGLSVGTPYYMSPEQATGDQLVGPPSDVYALGAVLYELLTGDPPYMGSTAQAVLGQIISGDPVAATKKRRSIPANVDAAIRKALEKLPADRFTDAQGFAKALADPAFRHDEAGQRKAAAVAGPWKRLAAVATLTTLAFAGLAGWALTHRPEPVRHVERFAMPFEEGEELTFLGMAGFDLSPDGTMLVYRHRSTAGIRLVARRWDELSATPIRETQDGVNPAVSPDGLELAFEQGDDIKVLAFAGGPVRTLTRGTWPEWGPDGTVYASTDSGTVRVPAVGGAVEYVTRLAEEEQFHIIYDVMPDGRHALMMAFRGNAPPEIRGLDLRTGAMTFLVPGFMPRYLSPGFLTYGTQVEGGVLTMMAVRFDPAKMEMLGTPVAVMDGLTFWSLSDDGKLFQTSGSSTVGTGTRVLQPIWVSRSGEATPIDPNWTFVQGGSDIGWRLSPDGTMLANRERTADGLDIWIKRLDAGPRSRLTFGEFEERLPNWSPDGRDVLFLSNRGGNLDVWSKPFDGTRDAELVLDMDANVSSAEWSPDGVWLILRTAGPRGAEGGRDIFVFRPGEDSVATPLLADPGYDEIYPALSPDGKLIAYQTTETDRHEIYVRPFPDVTSGRWQVSVDGGRGARWAHGGRELFFQGPDNEMMVVDVETSPSFRAGAPRMLFEGDPDWASGDISGTTYDVAPDDQRFVMARAAGSGEEAPKPVVVLVNNFVEELKARIPR
jgi:serine/threonine-protein kinase